MAAEIILLHRPAVDHSALNTITSKIAGRSPAAILDSANREFADDAKALIRLLAFSNPDAKNPLDALRNSQPVQGLLNYAFLVLATPGIFDEVVLLNTNLRFAIMDGDFERPCFILAGGLDDWREAVLVGCSEVTTPDTRQLFNKLNLGLDKLGLSEIWYGYKRTTQKDGTFLLIRA